MYIAVIHYRREPPWSAAELIKTIESMGHRPIYAKVSDLDGYIVDGEVMVYRHGEPFKPDAAIIRGLGLAFSLEQYMRRIGVLYVLERRRPVINRVESIMLCRDKWLTLTVLALKGLPVPDTVFTENPFTAKRFVGEHGPAVYKPPTGSLGLGSTLITDPEIAFQIARSLLAVNQPLYLQEYIEKPGYDIRVFIVGGEVVAAMKRVSPGGWKTNIAQGARGIPLRESEDPEAFELALKATEILGLDYSGVDIVIDRNTGKHMIIEANAFPLWRGLMEATHVNPAEHIIKYLIDKVKK